jgi:cytochrome P450
MVFLSTYLGIKFPKGTEFFLLLRAAIFRKGYPTLNPLEFNPDRWSDLDDETYRLQSNLFLSFGGGPRICPGQYLATTEMVYVLAYAISSFDLKHFPQLPSSPSPVEVAGVVVWQKDFYPMFVERKLNEE